MKKIIDWIIKHKILTAVITLFLLVIQPIIVQWMFKTKAVSPFWEKTWDAGDLLTYIAGFEAFIGTVFLGGVAIHQNNQANDLSDRILKNQELRDKFDRIPSISIIDCNSRFGEKFDGVTALRGAYFDRTDCAPEGLGATDQLLQLELKIINSSKVYAIVVVDKIEIVFDKSISYIFEYQKHLSNRYLNTILLDSAEESSFSITLPKNVFMQGTDTIGIFYLIIRNSINEEYQKTFSVKFVGDNSRKVIIQNSKQS